MRAVILSLIYFFSGFILNLYSTNIDFPYSDNTYLINNAKTYEVDALLTKDGRLICTWMEDRDGTILEGKQLKNVRVCYSVSLDKGKSWSQKKIIDFPNTLITANPRMELGDDGEVFLILMSVDESFFSSRLVLFQFNSGTLAFEIKSYPRSSSNTLLDKPSIVVKDDTLSICYVEFPSPPTSSKIVIQQSFDRGESWSDTTVLNTKGDVLYLGVSMKKQKDDYLLSVGSYMSDSIYFTANSIQNALTLSAIAPMPQNVSSGMTELEVGTREDILVSYQKNHAAGGLYISFSTNRGCTWSAPYQVDANGFLLSSAIDNKGIIHTSYYSIKNDSLSFLYQQLSLDTTGNFTSIPERQIVREKYNYKGYIGAFQKILFDDTGATYLFWIDYSTENQLYVTKVRE